MCVPIIFVHAGLTTRKPSNLHMVLQHIIYIYEYTDLLEYSTMHVIPSQNCMNTNNIYIYIYIHMLQLKACTLNPKPKAA